jgi:hypothetical protein
MFIASDQSFNTAPFGAEGKELPKALVTCEQVARSSGRQAAVQTELDQIEVTDY